MRGQRASFCEFNNTHPSIKAIPTKTSRASPHWLLTEAKLPQVYQPCAEIDKSYFLTYIIGSTYNKNKKRGTGRAVPVPLYRLKWWFIRMIPRLLLKTSISSQLMLVISVETLMKRICNRALKSNKSGRPIRCVFSCPWNYSIFRRQVTAR